MRALTRWGHGVTVGFGLQALGLGVDAVWHATHSEAEMAPFWAHLPIHAGIVVLAVAVALRLRHDRPLPFAAVVVAGVSLQVAGDAWSLAAQAEANGFYVPAGLIAAGGVLAFAGVVAPLVRSWRRSRSKRSVVGAT